MNYSLSATSGMKSQSAVAKLLALIKGEEKNIILALTAILINSGFNLLGPFIIGYAIDHYVVSKNYHGILIMAAILLCVYATALVAGYMQTTLMGGVAQRVLFNLRNSIFKKLQELPIAFFNQNKAGDLISRINSDTDKLNVFFSQSLMQFFGSFFVIIGAGIFLLTIHVRLGAASLVPAFALLIFSQTLSGWIRRRNAESMQATGGLSAEIQESLTNFRVIVAFNRRDYFRKRFSDANENNFTSSVKAGIANNVFTPVYGLCSNAALLIVLLYGIHLITQGNFTVGLLISYLSYVTRFYDPIRQMATLWASFQTAVAAWDRISSIMTLESDLTIKKDGTVDIAGHLLEFKDVHFHYPDGKDVLKNISFTLEPGKTYALVGPTGGGKTTTASLMARLYDPSSGAIFFKGKDLRSYTPTERSEAIGFILQEPFLFSGTVRENLCYGNDLIRSCSTEELTVMLKEANLDSLLQRFSGGLDSPISGGSDSLSLGQKQLIAFMRAVLRKPQLLVLDEATANIDTVTEKLLEDTLKKLPSTTTRVIIAHRLNTIANADEIFFVNSGEIVRAGSLDHAVEMLLHHKRKS